MSLFNNRPRRSGEHRTSAAARERILDAALEVICEDGYSGATMAKVAKKAQLPVGSVYWHFENKDMLLAALIELSFERWHSQIELLQQPLPGETFEQHVERIFGTGQPYYAADFWRLGVILSVEKSVREQVARERFLKIRQLQREELASWWQQVLPADLVEKNSGLPARLSGFTLALQDGNAIAGASGESIDSFRSMLTSSLIHLVAQATSESQTGAGKSATSRVRKTATAHVATAALKSDESGRRRKAARAKA
jgi:AcrR family transcriptional regulator